MSAVRLVVILMLASACSRTRDASQAPRLHAECTTDSDCDEGIECIHFLDHWLDAHAICDLRCDGMIACWPGMKCERGGANARRNPDAIPFAHCALINQ